MKRERKTRVRLIPKTETCITEWERAVKAYLKQGMTAREAVRKAYEEHPVMHELLTEVRERGEIQLKSGYGKPIPRKVAQRALEIPWAEDGLKLSERTTKGANLVRNWAARTIAKAIRNGDTAQELTKRLYDGFNFKGGKEILPAQDIPRYLRDLVNAGRKVDGYDAEYRNLLRRARSALERNEAGPLKAAYEEIIRAVETRSEKAIDKAVYVATQENTRYYARRIARTELQRAYQDGELAKYESDEDVVAYQWKRSSRHPHYDICDFYAQADLFNLGAGVFPKGKLPALPAHPNCLCYVKPVYAGLIDMSKEDEVKGYKNAETFINGLRKPEQNSLLGVQKAKEYRAGKRTWPQAIRGMDGGLMRSRLVLALDTLSDDELTDWMKEQGVPDYVQKLVLAGEVDKKLVFGSKEEMMSLNLLPPTDEYIEKLANQQNKTYTKGKQGEERFYADDGKPIYPPNDGVIGTISNISLNAGSMIVSRYGGNHGSYVSPDDTELEARSLSRMTRQEDYHRFKILKDVDNTEQGIIAPWFGKRGLGIQYKLSEHIEDLLNVVLEEI